MEPMKDLLLARLVAGMPRVMERFDASTGRFMTPGYEGPDLGWFVTNQDVMYPLALLYVTPHERNPYYHHDRLLDVIGRAGDAVRSWQYPDGQVEFIKADGSRWGPTYMPWTQYHWLEAYDLLAVHLDAARRRRWEEGLTLALDGTARQISKDYRVHNIPAWHGMTLVRAGQVFNRDDWTAVGREMIRRVAAAQTEYGYWDEHGGPTTSYNLVYMHALGLYYAFTGDASVLDVLRRGLQFHMTFTYPDGSMVETIDGRVKYHPGPPDRALPAWSLLPEGRRYARWLTQQANRHDPAGCTPATASACQHYVEGDEAGEPIPQETPRYEQLMGNLARVSRNAPWFSCCSAIVVEPTDNRWGMDRQSFLSLYHDRTGLIIGGGNSKNQPAWSNFVVGDRHLPADGRLKQRGVQLDYRPGVCSISMECSGDEAAVTLTLETAVDGQEVFGQLPLYVRPGKPIVTGAGEFATDGSPVRLTAEQAGGWVGYNGWRVEMPAGATFEYPILPFNPYAKDGSAPLDQAVAIVRAPLTVTAPDQVFRFRVAP